jgi:cation diffusion facilitator family transporter
MAAILPARMSVEPVDTSAEQRRTAMWSLVAAGVLVLLKLGTGLFTGSLALISAGVESSGDVIAALLTLLAIRMALRPADRSHNYGHRRAENIAALGEAAIVAVGGAIIAFEAIRLLIEGGHEVDARWYVFVVIAVALAIDVSRIVISLRAARKYNSAAFRSNAFNFAGDMAGSLAVLLGLGLVAAGVAAGDAIAALVVAVIIFLAVGRLVTENVRALMDYAPDASRAAIETALDGLDGSVELRRLRLREVGGRVFADVTVGLPPASPVAVGHDLADEIERVVQAAAPESDVVVHVEPRQTGVELRERILAIALADPDVADVHDVAIFTRGDGVIVSLHLKLDPDRSIETAHHAAERVEAGICAIDGVDAAHTHLEPLEAPIAVHREPRRYERLGEISAFLTTTLGHEPNDLALLDTDAGPILFITIDVEPELSLSDAHERASELERVLRAEREELVEVVVHTEPRSR